MIYTLELLAYKWERNFERATTAALTLIHSVLKKKMERDLERNEAKEI